MLELLLADSRFPAGGHVHSAGVEMAIEHGFIKNSGDVANFLRGRLRGIAGTQAAFAAAATDTTAWSWTELHHELSARTPAVGSRTASCAQGSALLRTAMRSWPEQDFSELKSLGKPHHAVVLGAVSGEAARAATLAVHHVLGGACSAAIRLLGLDPLEIAAVQVDLLPHARACAHQALDAVSDARGQVQLLPAWGAAMPDILATVHNTLEVTLFAS